MKLVFNEVAAFTREGTAAIGNPAAICVVDEFPPDNVMEGAARILGQPMTSFVRRTADAHVFDIRHFSPDGKENHVCGHATLAAVEELARHDPALRDGKTLAFNLNPKYAINAGNAFHASVNGKDITLTVPAVTELQRVDNPEFYRRLAEGLGIGEADIVRPAYYAPRIINYVVEIADQEKLTGMRPDFNKLRALATSAEFPHEGIMATAKSNEPGYDFMTRVFLPVIGVDEDIACGSANCSVVPYWTGMRPGVFEPGRRHFKALFPYPPGAHENASGGVQDLHIDHENGEVAIKGQATWRQRLLVVEAVKPRQAQAAPRPLAFAAAG